MWTSCLIICKLLQLNNNFRYVGIKFCAFFMFGLAMLVHGSVIRTSKSLIILFLFKCNRRTKTTAFLTHCCVYSFSFYGFELLCSAVVCLHFLFSILIGFQSRIVLSYSSKASLLLMLNKLPPLTINVCPFFFYFCLKDFLCF
ncbi:hypothetical protein FOCC_FOCC009326 [Frankliniella occidentalis]|nr:hypothetical protein FOCC_FOCC009326 [Frankliniella occidentalis]